jgi:prenyltransferase beta subunit
MRFGIVALLLLLAAQANASNVSTAIDWLKQNQNADGSFFQWFSAHEAAALLALHANDSASSNTSAALNWLSISLTDTSDANYATWGEADGAGLALYALFQTNHSLIDANLTGITAKLRSFQASSGGFRGLWDNANGTWEQVENSVDTSWSLLGLLSAGAINDTAKAAAIDYLQSLQNQDGSVNLTGTSAMNPLSALGLDAAAQTSLALLALNAANGSDAAKQSALVYVKNATCAGTGVFGASMAALALERMNASDFAAVAVRRIATLQNASSGGFSDTSRSSSAPNAIDTGFAALAMQRMSDVAADSASICAPYIPAYAPLPTLVFGESIPNGTQQRIMLKAPGLGFAVASNTASASISIIYEGAESVWLVPSFNPQTDAYEVLYGNTARTGRYLVSAALSFGSNTATVNRTFSVIEPSEQRSPTGGSNGFVRVLIPSAGIDQNVLCAGATAYECLAQVASIGCKEYAGLGCFVTSVNGVVPDFYRDNAWWAFCYNGAFSSNGVSNQRVAAGDTILLKYVTGSERSVSCALDGAPAPVPAAARQTPVATPSATPLPQQGALKKALGASAYARFDANDASVLVVFAPAAAFSGSISYRFPIDYAAYGNGSIMILPKPSRTAAGSIYATWENVSIAAGGTFNVTLHGPGAAAAFANLTEPVLELRGAPEQATDSAQKEEVSANATAAVQAAVQSNVQPASGAATAKNATLPALLAVLAAATVLAYLARRKPVKNDS